MLDRLTKEAFSPHLGTIFCVQVGVESVLEMELIQVSAIGSGARGVVDGRNVREPFSILFRGPVDPLLP